MQVGWSLQCLFLRAQLTSAVAMVDLTSQLREAVQLKLLTVTEKSGRVIAVDVSENAWGTNDVAV